ncbi:hypothetical protein [Streptomyces sp. NPDC057702]|uniref:hypothetical protein n=1 Tax=unclassified Streptomyces TaxID=2593676 RepID=UPI0036957A40
MWIGLLSAIGIASYGGTVSLLALTATFAPSAARRHEARATLAVLTPGTGGSTAAADTAGPAGATPPAAPGGDGPA